MNAIEIDDKKLIEIQQKALELTKEFNISVSQENMVSTILCYWDEVYRLHCEMMKAEELHRETVGHLKDALNDALNEGRPFDDDEELFPDEFKPLPYPWNQEDHVPH